MNPNRDNNYIYIGIVSSMLELPAKGIFSVNDFRDFFHFYDNKPRKLGGKQRLVTSEGRKSHMFISDGLAYLPVIYPTNERMDWYPKSTLNSDGEWKPLDIYDDSQWDDSDDDASFGANVSATSYTRSDYVIEYILSDT